MYGLMQERPLMISDILRHAARHHGRQEIVSRLTDGTLHRQDYAMLERRARRLVRVLQNLGVRPGDRVATLAWNSYRHLELYYAISGSGARLSHHHQRCRRLLCFLRCRSRTPDSGRS